MTVSVDAVVYFNVIDAELALCSVDDFRLVLKSFKNIFCHFDWKISHILIQPKKWKIRNVLEWKCLHQYQLMNNFRITKLFSLINL